ncbi:MAG TPA: glutamate-5-semialdehyde dehydrogenase [Bacteroidales bacterium]|nr:glutamate-5-semialdehyde dehydrogenase [Bacteroidales bacterium]
MAGKMNNLEEYGKKAKIASRILAGIPVDRKNEVLNQAADHLIRYQGKILEENSKDIKAARNAGVKGALLDRLMLNEGRIASMAEGLRQIAMLEDPVGEVLWMKQRPNGLLIGQQRVPLGVVGVIYEARPNVTADVAGLCLKTGNAAILRGGREAIFSNRAIVECLQDALKKTGLPEDSIQLVTDTSRESALALMRMNQYLDVLIPRGGAGLIKSVVENSTVPVIETGTGNCHVFIDSPSDLRMGIDIIVNAKTHRPGVCNAAETLLVHKDMAEIFLPEACRALSERNVEIRGDEKVCTLVPYAKKATEEDWATEYLDLILAVRVVESIDEAIDHIQKYSTGHSEAIVTNDYSHARRFLQEVDSAAVYVNASTRFTDGFEFGFGAEVGISTQKLHARGPMGLKELTTYKYIVFGNGQIRQ